MSVTYLDALAVDGDTVHQPGSTGHQPDVLDLTGKAFGEHSNDHNDFL